MITHTFTVNCTHQATWFFISFVMILNTVELLINAHIKVLGLILYKPIKSSF